MFTKGKLGEKDWLTPHSCAWTTERECVCGVCVWERELRERDLFFFRFLCKRAKRSRIFLQLFVDVGFGRNIGNPILI